MTPRRPTTAFVGQGPNRASWEHGLEVGARMALARAGEFAGYPEVQRADAVVWAESYTARVAITGRVGEDLARLAGMERLTFYARHARLNLNRQWRGKKGKGDDFDTVEGRSRAAAIKAEGYERLVLLGASVALCFGLDFEPLAVHQCPGVPATRVLLMPHPSRIVTWWNDPDNRAAAAAVLRTFIQ